MTLDDDSWSDYFDSITDSGERLRATVTLARVPLSPVRARRPGTGVLEGIRFNRAADEVEVRVRRNGTETAWLRYFVPSPRSVTVEEGESGRRICVTDAAGLRTVIELESAREADARERRGAGAA